MVMTQNSYKAKVSRAERRVIKAALKLADAGGGFVFKDNRQVSDTGHAMRLEKACEALKRLYATGGRS
jgi:hypothetical protein